jgi:hypothetical protein
MYDEPKNQLTRGDSRLGFALGVGVCSIFRLSSLGLGQSPPRYFSKGATYECNVSPSQIVHR